LIERSYPSEDDSKEKQWKRFETHVVSLEAAKKEGESYKVLFLGRHGQGWHNVAEAKYGTKAWDVCCHCPSTTFPISSHSIFHQTPSESGISPKGVDYGFTPTLLLTLLFTLSLHRPSTFNCVFS
jgi:hypothetical protein